MNQELELEGLTQLEVCGTMNGLPSVVALAQTCLFLAGVVSTRICFKLDCSSLCAE